ncbi:MAG: penicillin-binding protein 2 [Chloroflexi bacterium]|nr:penicillin-binding protein 2 [Chloroflexota bacterium]
MSAQTLPRAPARMRLALYVLAAVGVILAGRLFYWQIIEWDKLNALAIKQQTINTEIPPHRGSIRTSDGLLLAADRYLYSVRVTYKMTRDPQDQIKIAGELAAVLGQPIGTVVGKLQSDKPDWLARDVTAPVGEAIIALKEKYKLTNLEIETRLTRYYPAGALAGPVVGFVNVERKPSSGVEASLHKELTGKPGKLNAVGDAMRDVIPFDVPANIAAEDGADITLTIDATMQRIVEMELANALRATRAASGSIIVLDPKTGAVLALAVLPSADLNAYYEPANQDRYKNTTVSALYEPGSVFKVITLAAALDARTVTPATVFEDIGYIDFGGAHIENHDKKAYGRVTLTDVMRHSLNVEAVKMSVGMGAERFYQYVRDFGFGSITRIELMPELAGDVKSPGDGIWRDVELATNAFGQGISATPLQMARAMAAVANQGKLMRPYIVKEARESSGRRNVVQSQSVRQVIRPETAQIVTRILADSILAESSNKALVPGYRVAGKTGTSQISGIGGYEKTGTVASFAGYLPADDPRFVILVKLDRPQTSEWGSQVASPVFAEVAKQLVALVGLPPDAVRLGK